MVRAARLFRFLALFIFSSVIPLAFAQAPAAAPSAYLRTIHAQGLQHVTQEQLTQISGLKIDQAVTKADLQTAADNLVQTGLFSKVDFSFDSHEDNLNLTFKVVEATRIPAYFDNFPWFADSELNDAIRKALPFYDGTLPEAGPSLDRVSEVLSELVASRGLHTAVDHQVVNNPLGEGSVQEFRIAEVALNISKLEFGDKSLDDSKVLQQHLPEIVGKPYSRMTIDLFLAEQVQPIYKQRGMLRVKLGPPEVRLTGNPNDKLPSQIPVFVPVETGTAYKLNNVQWSGNSVVNVFALSQLLGIKPGDSVNGMTLDAGWDRIREEYGHRGYLDAQVEPVADYNEQSHTVFYRANIAEGRQYKFEKLVLTGMSVTSEKRLRAAWPILQGDLFDKEKYEEMLVKLQAHPEQIFVDLPIHYQTLGHWVQRDETKGTVDVLLDFQ
jgi:outer membrane protein insertion porin family